MLLIAPKGIEISTTKTLPNRWILLIAPKGIEILLKCLTNLNFTILLIAPKGIEMDDVIPVSESSKFTFNRTKRN